MSSQDAGHEGSAELRRQAEEKARENAAQTLENRDALSPEAAQQVLHELRVHQIELEMQNEELRRAQVELEVSRARYYDLYDLAPIGYFTFGEQGLILEANLTLAGLLGVARGALVRQPLTRFILPEDQDIHYRHRQQLVETGAPQAIELRMLRAGAAPFWARVEVTAAQDGEGGAPVYRALLSDITKRKLAESEREQLLFVLKTNNERLDILSEAGSRLLASDTPESMVQAIATKVMRHLDCDCFFNFVVEPDTVKLRLNAFAGISDEDAKQIEWLEDGVAVCACVARDGQRIVCEDVQNSGDVRSALARSFGMQAYVCHPLTIGARTIGTLSFGTRTRTRFDDDECELMRTVAGLVSVAMERKRAEEKVERYAAELEASNAALEAFSYTLSHDLRTPIRAIAGFAQMIEEDCPTLDAETKRKLGVIQQNAVKMRELIEALLAFARLGQSQIRPSAVDMTGLAREVSAEIGEAHADVPIHVDLRALPPALADRTLVRQVFQNLLENAVKFSRPKGEVRIEIGGETDDGECVYRVRDHGVGFDMQYSGKLFGVFQRLQHEFDGTGIGLAFVKRIVERHGGHVWAEAKPDEGATFYFALPCAPR